jgi:hypothetical protein
LGAIGTIDAGTSAGFMLSVYDPADAVTRKALLVNIFFLVLGWKMLASGSLGAVETFFAHDL